MSKNKEQEFTTEFENGIVDVETELPEGQDEKKERQTYTLKDGTQGSRSAYIKELFLQDGMSRKDIEKEHGFAYREVYSATVNLSNGTENASRGRAPVNATIQVTAAEHQYTNIVTDAAGDSHYFVNGVEVSEADASAIELIEMNRNDWIKEQVELGVSRGDIAKMLDLSYGVIYGLTKEAEGTRQRYEYEVEIDGEMKTISRAEYIRHLYAGGMSRGDIAKELEVQYPVVWQATKVEKTDADRFADLINEIAAFADKVDENYSGISLEQAVASLKEITIKEEVKEDTSAE